MAGLMGLNLWSGPGFIFELVLNFKFLSKHFPFTTLGLELFSGTCHNSLLSLWLPMIENYSF
jgi:hypothetical protein